jgi:TRAP-type C4-dicarboxylate transport system substrate-binding protein
MRTSRKFGFGIGALAAAVAFAGQAAAMDLVYGSWTPAVSYVNRVGMPKIFKEIKEETKGEINWRIVPGGQLAGPKDSFQAATDGLANATFGIAIYAPNLVPSLNTIYSTLVFEGGSIQATPAALETMTLDCPSCLEDFRKINIAPLSGWTTSQYHLACREPITRVEDLKGKRIRGTGGPAQLWELAGATPVSSTLPESLTLLQRGGLDCMHTTFTWLQTFSYGDYGKYVTDFPLSLSGPAIGLMINRDTWKKFTTEQKALHLKKAAWVSASEAVGDFTQLNNRFLAKVKKEKGVKMVKAEEAGFKALVEKFDKVQRASVIAASEKFGVKDPGKIIDAYKKNLAKWTKLTADIGEDTDKLADLIWEHIYSKVDPASY